MPDERLTPEHESRTCHIFVDDLSRHLHRLATISDDAVTFSQDRRFAISARAFCVGILLVVFFSTFVAALRNYSTYDGSTEPDTSDLWQSVLQSRNIPYVFVLLVMFLQIVADRTSEGLGAPIML